jgi:hypothetical protein
LENLSIVVLVGGRGFLSDGDAAGGDLVAQRPAGSRCWGTRPGPRRADAVAYAGLRDHQPHRVRRAAWSYQGVAITSVSGKPLISHASRPPRYQ